MPTLTPIRTQDAPAAAGHYSQAMVHAGLAYVSGQLGRRPDGSDTAGEPFEVQARQAIDNLLRIVEAAGGRPDRIVRLTAYIVGVEHWASFNRLWAQAMGGHRPARTVVPVPELHHGYLVELDAVAALGDD